MLYEQALYDRIDRDAAWNDPVNTDTPSGPRLSEQELSLFRSPRTEAEDSEAGETHYFAVVGDETLWPESGGVSFDDIPDGAENTILFVEAFNRDALWPEPRDVTIDEAVDLLTGTDEETWVESSFFYSIRYRGNGCRPRNVAFADGSVRSLKPIVGRAFSRGLLTRNGGEAIDMWKSDPVFKSAEQRVVSVEPNWGVLAPTAMFVGMAAWPLTRKRRVVRADRGLLTDAV